MLLVYGEGMLQVVRGPGVTKIVHVIVYNNSRDMQSCITIFTTGLAQNNTSGNFEVNIIIMLWRLRESTVPLILGTNYRTIHEQY